MRGAIKRLAYRMAEQIVGSVPSSIWPGVGTILVFHRVIEPSARPRAGWARDLETSPAFLSALVARLRATGCAFVSMDELVEALTRGTRRATKLIAITFDDGYADNHDVAFPLFTGEGIPVTFYVATDFPDRRVLPWWYLLEDLLTRGPELDLRLRDRAVPPRLDTEEQREAAFSLLATIFDTAPRASHRAVADEVFGAEEVERAIGTLCIRWDQVQAMAAHPLVTIGAHSVTHPILKALPEAEARWEMTESRSRIEQRIGRPVRHFAYPYGSSTQIGAREHRLARECGFTTAVTSRRANVTRESERELERLPRVFGESLGEIAFHLSGISPALRGGAAPAA